jgi:glyoxylase-like metal-dependent hydrolase (beta-lactamase superfamily II)
MFVKEPPVEVGGNVWMLGTMAYPVYLVRGQGEGAIIEGGISALKPILAEQLGGLGVGPDFVRQLVITHAHPDHVMAVPILRQMFPGASVVASAPAAATLGVDKAVAFFRQIDTALTGALHQAGQIAEASPPPDMENRVAVERVVRDGDTISLGGSSWTVLETPGHSDCSISLHDPAEGVLVISDATGYFLPSQDGWWPNYFTDYAAYLRSMERLAALDAEFLCLSHNGAVKGREAIREYFAGAIEATRKYHQRIVDETKAGKPTRQLAEELGAEIHRLTPVLPVDFFQKNCGLLVKQSLKYAEAHPTT